jgi:hypothetical protein
MSEKSNWWENQSLILMFLTYDPIYVSLHTVNPGEDATGDEVVSAQYSRQSIAASAWTVTGDTATNNNVIEYTEATASWGTITHCALWTSASGGNMLYYTPLNSSVAIGDNQIFRFDANALTITEA